MRFLASIIRRLSITKPASDVDDVRVQQGSIMGKVVDVEVYFPYGSSGNVPAGSLCTVLQVGGDEGYLIVLPDRSQDRVKGLAEGEVAYFNPLTKTCTIFRANGDLEQQVNGEKRVTITKDLNIVVEGDVNLTVSGVANVEIPTTNWKGDIIQDGTLTNTQTTSNGIDLDGHTHTGSATAATGPVSDTGASQ